MVSSGFDTDAKRQWGVWDLRNLEAPLSMGPLGESTGVSMITYDAEHKILYAVGKGDQEIEFYSYDSSKPQLFNLSSRWTMSDNTKAFSFLGKQNCDISKQEVGRAVRLTQAKKIENIGFRIPSRTGAFKEDLYPPFPANEPSNTVEKWAANEDAPVKTMQLKPSMGGAKKAKGSGLSKLKGGAATTTAPTEEAKATDSADLAKLQAEITQLKAQLAAGSASAGSTSSFAEDMSTTPELGYWNIRGFGASIRHLFSHLGVNYTYTGYNAGPEPDFNRDEWMNVKFTLGFEYPNLPYLKDGETKLTETYAILKYVAIKYNPALAGTGAAEIARIDMLAPHCKDLTMASRGPAYGSGDVEEIISGTKDGLAKFAEAIGNGWVAGANLTWLDFFFAENLIFLDKVSDGLILAQNPVLREYLDRFLALPGVQNSIDDINA